MLQMLFSRCCPPIYCWHTKAGIEMKNLKPVSSKVALLVLGFLLAGVLGAQAAEPGLTVSPANVQITTFFNGQTVTVSSTIPAGAQAVLEVMGTSADEHLMRKGRRGFLWMNVGEITVHDAPSLYLVMSTAKELLTAAPATATWGYRSLEKRIVFTGNIEPAERQLFLKQFLELKESEHIYATFPGVLKVEPAAGGASPVTASFPLPTNTRPGTYKVVPVGDRRRQGGEQHQHRPHGRDGGLSGHDGEAGLRPRGRLRRAGGGPRHRRRVCHGLPLQGWGGH